MFGKRKKEKVSFGEWLNGILSNFTLTRRRSISIFTKIKRIIPPNWLQRLRSTKTTRTGLATKYTRAATTATSFALTPTVGKAHWNLYAVPLKIILKTELTPKN